MKIQEWKENNRWCKEIPFKIAFRNGGGLGDIIHTCITGSTLTILQHFKQIFPKTKIGLWLNSHNKETSIEFFKTNPIIDEIVWKQEETPYSRINCSIIWLSHWKHILKLTEKILWLPR